MLDDHGAQRAEPGLGDCGDPLLAEALLPASPLLEDDRLGPVVHAKRIRPAGADRDEVPTAPDGEVGDGVSVRSQREAAFAEARLEPPARAELDEDRACAVIGGATLDRRGGGNHDVAVPKDDERTFGGVLGAGIGDEDRAVLRERGIQRPVGEQPGHHHVGKGKVPLVRTRRREDDAPVRHSRREQTSECDQPSVDHAVRAEGRVKTAIREQADQPDARRAAVRIGNRRNEKLPVGESQRARVTAAGDEVSHAGVRAAEVRVAASVRIEAERRGRTLDAADVTGAEDDDLAVGREREVTRAG